MEASLAWHRAAADPHARCTAIVPKNVVCSCSEADGLYLVPALARLGAPHWNDAARGLISGLTRGSTAAHVARAAIEAIAYQVRDVFDVMQAEAGVELSALLADGGASRNDTLMQFQADILGQPVLHNSAANASALGAAHLAGLAVGIWQSLDELAQLPRARDRFAPRMPEKERAERYAGWRLAVARAILGTTASRTEADTGEPSPAAWSGS